LQKTTLGVIVGNREFFPDWLCDQGRKQMLQVLKEEGFEAICLTPDATKGGAIENYTEAKKCAELFRRHADQLDGIVVTLPNFGDETSIANAIRLSGLQVPILVHAFPDNLDKMMDASDRRDSFCGKMSVCNNLRQYGYAYTLTSLHTVNPESPSFRADLRRFGAICRVVRGLKGLRLGAIGARPGAFNTVRFSEKLLESSGISVLTLDLSEIIGRAKQLTDGDPKVTAKLDAVRSYLGTSRVPTDALLRVAKFGVVVEDWMKTNELQAAAVQCWNAIQEFYGISPCTIMSMLSNQLIPAACEVDITGALSMFILQQASGQPSALVDWNNNYGDNEDKAIIFHCCNFPRDILTSAEMEYPPILASTLGQANSYGSVSGRIKSGAFTFGRISTDDEYGTIKAYVGEGRLTDDPLLTFGGHGVIEIKRLQKLLHYICENGFEHHVAVNLSTQADAVAEALDKYMGWEVYHHNAD